MSGSDDPSPLPPDLLDIQEGGDYVLGDNDKLPYKLTRVLGQGHCGVVEEVKDVRNGAVFARKTIRLYGPRKKEEGRRFFENEIKIIRKLAGHHHIIRVFATYVEKRQVGLILKPVADGGDLHSFLDQFREDMEDAGASCGRLVDMERAGILKRAVGCLASGLEFMHAQKIRHKDIKPGNILVHRGSVIYTDFGYSLDSSHLSHSTTAGRPSFFTRRYSAPEVLDYDTRNSQSDIFSLGAVFIEILSILSMNLDVDPQHCFAEDLDSIHRSLEERAIERSMKFLAQICLRMTRREPARRPIASEIFDSIQGLEYSCLKCKLVCEISLSTENVANLVKSHTESSTITGLGKIFLLSNNGIIMDQPVTSRIAVMEHNLIRDQVVYDRGLAAGVICVEDEISVPLPSGIQTREVITGAVNLTWRHPRRSRIHVDTFYIVSGKMPDCDLILRPRSFLSCPEAHSPTADVPELGPHRLQLRVLWRPEAFSLWFDPNASGEAFCQAFYQAYHQMCIAQHIPCGLMRSEVVISLFPRIYLPLGKRQLEKRWESIVAWMQERAGHEAPHFDALLLQPSYVYN